MKKHLIAVFVAVVTCLTALSGCSLVRGFEKDLQVVFEVDGKYYDSGTVNIFNNAVVEEPAAPKGYYFRGWTNTAEWTEEESVTVPVLENTGLVRYNDIKDMVQAGRESVTLYGVFSEIVRHDLKVAWYDKETTSGLNQTAMDGFKAKLYAYLTEEGKNPESLDIIIQGYDGDVGTSCSAIMKHGDVDIMVGWAGTSNLTGTGGMPAEDILENVGKVKIGSKDRYAARLSDTELTKLVYIWIQNEYGAGYVPPVVEPDPEPTTKTELVIAYYNNNSDASGISAQNMNEFKTKLDAYIATQETYKDSVSVIIKDFIGGVETTCNSVKSDDSICIMVGWNDKITDYMTVGTDFVEKTDGNTVKIGSKNRGAALVKDTELNRLVYVWIQTEYGVTV